MMFVKRAMVVVSVALLAIVGIGAFVPTNTQAASSCQKGSFLGLPTWYEYLEFDSECNIKEGQSIEVMAPRVGLAIVEILIRISGMIAVGYIIYGGFRYMLSQGEPDATKKAKGTILNAIIGLIIAITATFAVTLVGNIL